MFSYTPSGKLGMQVVFCKTTSRLKNILLYSVFIVVSQIFSLKSITAQKVYIENIDQTNASQFGNIDVYDIASSTLVSVMSPNQVFDKSEGWQMVGKDGELFYFQVTDDTKSDYGQIDTWDGIQRQIYGNLSSEFDLSLWNLSGVDDGLLYFQAYDPTNALHGHIDTWDGSVRQSSVARINQMVSNDDANIMTGISSGNTYLQWINSGGSYGDLKSWDGTSLQSERSLRSIYGLSGTATEIYRMAGREDDPIAINPSAFLNSLDRIRAHIDGSNILTANELTNEQDILELDQLVLADNITAIQEAFSLIEFHDTTVGAVFTLGTPSEAGFSSSANGFELEHLILFLQQAILDHSYTEENLKNYPAVFENNKFETSSYFPGAVDIPTDPNAMQTIQIDGTHLRSSGSQAFAEDADERNPTGCYLAPGSVAEVTVPPSLVGIGASIMVGAHTWDLTSRPNIKRMFRVTKTYEINSTTVTIGNPLGGGIYIFVPFDTDLGVIDITMKNVVRSPFYSRTVANQTSLQEWLNVQRNNPAPWADFETEKFMMQVPTSWIYAMNDPVSLMDDYDDAMDAVSEIHSRPLIRTKKVMYFQVDVQFRGAAWFPGYPMSNVNYNPYANTNGYNITHWSIAGPRVNTSSFAFMFHELGHQENIFKLMGEVEAYVHVPFMAARTRAFGIPIEEAFTTSFQPNMNMTIDNAAVSWMITSNFRTDNQMRNINGGREAAYQHRGWGKYAEIVRMFGWGPIEGYFQSFSIEADNGIFQQRVNGSDQDTDDRILRLSKAAGYDLRPLVHFWGIHPQDPDALAIAIESDISIKKSCLIYDQLQYYRTLVPMTNQAFREFGLDYFSQSSIENYNGTNIWSFQQGFFNNWWNDYDVDEANGAIAEIDLLLNLYFPDVIDNNCEENEICPDLDDQLIGTSCDDGVLNTINDIWTNTCECTGNFVDSDGDGVADVLDICEGFDDLVDSDGDGLPDGCDDILCPSMDETVIGTPCVDLCFENTINTNCTCEASEQIALEGTASMSSQFNGTLTAENLIDGMLNDDNNQLAHTSSTSLYEWIEIDLGEQDFISNIAIKNRTNCCSDRLSNAYVMVSSSAFPADIDLLASLANAEYIYQIGDALGVEHIGMDVNVTARYVRIQKSGNNINGNALNLRELEIYSPADSPTLVDNDGDGICDRDDVCPSFDDNLIGTTCDDGDECTIGETYNDNCNCSGGTLLTDSDGDGICDSIDICPDGDDNLDTDSDGIPDACDTDIDCLVIASDEFESGTSSFWMSGGIDAAIVESGLSPSGNHSMRIRDNSFEASSFSSQAIDGSSYDNLNISFDYIAFNFISGESFLLEMSLDGGLTYEPIRIWNATVDFVNNQDYQESLIIQTNATFTSVIFRFRSNGSINADEVFIDNIIIEGCNLACIDYITNLNNEVQANSQKAAFELISNEIIPANSIVEFTAGEFVELLPGFEVMSSAIFDAFIENCDQE